MFPDFFVNAFVQTKYILIVNQHRASKPRFMCLTCLWSMTCREASENFDRGVVAWKESSCCFGNSWRCSQRGYVSWRACALRLFKLLSTVKLLLFLTGDLLCHVLKSPKFTETFTSELGLDEGYFDRIYGTLFSLVNARSSSLNFFVNNKSVKTILLVVLEFMLKHKLQKF